MALKNYTTTIKVEKTIQEIETNLAKHGATHILKMYNEDGITSSLAFKCFVNEQLISFKLPMEEEKILKVFENEYKEGKLSKKYADNVEQARRTGWRIIKNWIDAQIALIEIHIVTFEEVFLPYMYDEKNDETLFEKLKKTDFKFELDYKEK